jgi:hypothetical protein
MSYNFPFDQGSWRRPVYGCSSSANAASRGGASQPVNTDEELMKSFMEREKGFEAEFKRKQELMFRVTARRNSCSGCGRSCGWVCLPARRQGLCQDGRRG